MPARLPLCAPKPDQECVLRASHERLAVQTGMAQMSEQFKSVGAEVYLDEATVEATV